ncbi:MarR family winged helix-turn-helix transcriptional regulator [Variovorax terrae]|uniref:MarR family transcriptional regulator n=1 Tax=Variovorax terrae TaxID=2923278 RepID=A0A9X1VZM6_9BURK|nr:MarR family transcriptional regulator [Variovorax terrae]MCJ0765119.1 MarR family transcriptional regulator [Variovorax terrae]
MTYLPDAPRLGHPKSMDDLLLYRLSRLLGVAGSMVIRLCEGRFGITRREWRVLALLAQDEGLLSSQLAERAQLDRARTSRAITSLVAKRLLVRQPRPGDRRQAALALTDGGRALYAELFPLVVQLNASLLSVLEGSDVHRLDAALDELQQRADAMVAQAELPKADRRRGGRTHRGMD